MQADAAISPAERERLAALHRLAILDTAPEPAFDDIAAVARAVAGTEIALVSLVDANRQWFKARVGLEAQQTPRSVSFCHHAIEAAALLVIPDARRDPRFADNGLVTGPPFIRFYAGAPIMTREGHMLGTVCVIDSQPRAEFTQGPALEALARQTALLLETRMLSAEGMKAHAAIARDLDRLWTFAHDLLVVIDLQGHVLAANPAWERVFGSAEPSGSVRMARFLVDPAQRPDLTLIADGDTAVMLLDYVGADNAVRAISWTLRRENGMVYGIGRDDTALRAAERELAQAQRMESLGQLTGGIAHDFNNLLTIVIGNLDIATRRLERGDTARVSRALKDANEGAGRAATLTQSLLAFARRQRLTPRAIDPAALLAGMRALLERAASEAVTLEIVVDGDVWPIEADPGQLENAIINLAVNARDAMAGLPGAARLTVAVANAPLDEDIARRHGAAAGDHVRFSLIDTGSGMTAETVARAFEPFFTTKSVGRGTGLGLSQVDGFVRQSGGFVTIDTAPGHGTSVHLWLPRSHAEPDELPPLIVPAAITPPSRATVMVVEDNDAVRELVVETLRDAGYRVVEAHDGRSALSLFSRQPIPPDLVVSDVMMPLIDGFQLTTEILERVPDTRVLLMSGYVGGAAEAHANGVALIAKPFTSAELLDRVRLALTEDQGEPLTPEIQPG